MSVVGFVSPTYLNDCQKTTKKMCKTRIEKKGKLPLTILILNVQLDNRYIFFTMSAIYILYSQNYLSGNVWDNLT